MGKKQIKQQLKQTKTYKNKTSNDEQNKNDKSKQTNKQQTKQNKQASKQANKQTSKQAKANKHKKEREQIITITVIILKIIKSNTMIIQIVKKQSHKSQKQAKYNYNNK